MNDFHVQIATAIPPIEPHPSSKGRTFRADISINSSPTTPYQKSRRKAFIKMLTIEDIAREALCAVLARKFFLPILQPFYVSVDPSYLGENRTGNIQNVAFGLEEDFKPALRIYGSQLETEILSWPEILPCAAFDEWIANSDRLPHNLLFAGDRHFWMIDHDECLPRFLSPDAPANSGLIRLLSRDKSEFELRSLRKDLMKHAEGYKNTNWDEVLDLLCPAHIPGIEQYYLEFFAVLKHRANLMFDIITRSLSLKQREMDLTLAKNLQDTVKK